MMGIEITYFRQLQACRPAMYYLIIGAIVLIYLRVRLGPRVMNTKEILTHVASIIIGAALIFLACYNGYPRLAWALFVLPFIFGAYMMYKADQIMSAQGYYYPSPRQGVQNRGNTVIY